MTAERLRAAQEAPPTPSPAVSSGTPLVPNEATGPTEAMQPPLAVAAVVEAVQYEEVCSTVLHCTYEYLCKHPEGAQDFAGFPPDLVVLFKGYVDSSLWLGCSAARDLLKVLKHIC